ncbi:hypothetical protein ACEWY4_010182 [Coilia grayii]|uniref:Sodium/calcium exchanger membrane region domain-containing protein n=1 Tax=Coilia grayii TaxID=363190 RepID=A0ABD1K977_9TELE
MIGLPSHLQSFLPLLLLCWLDVSTSLSISLSAQGNGSSGISSGVPQKASCSEQVVCKAGVLLPVWFPQNISTEETAGRAVIYFSSLLYMFLGVSIIADRFMAAIEVITSQICGHGFHAGELGPGAIVGSAAFNMFVIIGLCVSAIPAEQSRKIKHLRVFFVTAFWSIFAYIWLYLILAVISPGIVETSLATVWLAVTVSATPFLATGFAAGAR